MSTTTASKLARDMYASERKRLTGALKLVIEEHCEIEGIDPKAITREQATALVKDFQESADEALAEGAPGTL